MTTGRGARVLVFDDNDDDIELLRITFERCAPGCTLLGATTRQAAESYLHDPRLRPDLMLLDWKIAGVNCPDLLRTLRRDRHTAGLAAVVFSSSDDPADVRVAMEAGATAYVLKPRNLDDYEAFVRDLHGFWCRMALYV